MGKVPGPATLLAMDATQQVRAAAEARAAALTAGDADRLTELLHEDFRWASHTGESFDRTEYVRRNTDGGTVWRSQTLVDADIVVVGEAAVLRAEVTDVIRRAGRDEDETLRMPVTQVWVHLADRWLCLAGHAGPRHT